MLHFMGSQRVRHDLVTEHHHQQQIRPEIIKLLEEIIGGMFFDTGLSNNVLDMSPQERETKPLKKEISKLCKPVDSVFGWLQSRATPN